MGRPMRDAFLAELRRLMPEEGAGFAHRGLAIQTVRQVPVSGKPSSAREVPVDVMELPPSELLKQTLGRDNPCIAARPVSVGSVALVESTLLGPHFSRRAERKPDSGE